MSDRFPTELWEKIFAHSCTDDGFAGRSLSMVSRAFNLTSRPFKLHSITLHGLCQIVRFSHVLKNTPQGLGKLRHLFVYVDHPHHHETDGWNGVDCLTYGRAGDRSGISDPDDDSHSRSGLSRLVSGWRHEDPHRARNHRRDWSQGRSEREVSMTCHALCILLLSSASTLETLHLCFSLSSPFSFALQHRPRLMALTELSVAYTTAETTVAANPCQGLAKRIIGAFTTTPSLYRLSIVESNAEALFSDIFGSITTLAPHLTHLCLPAVYHGLDRALGLSHPLAHYHSLPPTLEKIFITLGKPPLCHCGRSAQHKEIGVTCDIPIPRNKMIVLIPYEVVHDEDLTVEENWEWEWSERVNGRGGIWDENQQMLFDQLPES